MENSYHKAIAFTFLLLASNQAGASAELLLRGGNKIQTESSDLSELTCTGTFGNQCGPLHECIETFSESHPFICVPKIGIEVCDVDCGDHSTCVHDMFQNTYECECDHKYSRNDIYFDCTIIEDFNDGNQFPKLTWFST